MPAYKEIEGILYRIADAKYNGVRLTCFIPEEEYKQSKLNSKTKKRTSKTPRYVLESQLDDVWPKVIKQRDKICQKCHNK